MLPASIMESISDGYDKLWREFIKPSRTNYSVEDLGAKVCCGSSYLQIDISGDDCYLRKDFQIPISQGNKVVASFFHTVSEQELTKMRTQLGGGENFIHRYDKSMSLDVAGQGCVIYCHSHNGNRVEGKFLRETCNQNKYCLCLFDFLGHGQSEGEYVVSL